MRYISFMCGLFLFACMNEKDRATGAIRVERLALLSAANAMEIIYWVNSFDLDGDGKNDRIYFSYSGGGHCCYKIFIDLTSDGKKRTFPFEMDGGYAFGLVNNSQPEQFDIQDIDGDGLPEIMMKI